MAASTVEKSDPNYFYYMSHPKPIRTSDLPVEVSPYRIPTLTDISAACMIYRRIGKQGHVVLVDSCKVTLSNDIRSGVSAISKEYSKSGSTWTGGGALVNLARLYLCQNCSQTQLSDVVVAWMHELENMYEPRFTRAGSVVGDHEKKSTVTDLAPVKTLVAASVATRDLFIKVCGFWP